MEYSEPRDRLDAAFIRIIYQTGSESMEELLAFLLLAHSDSHNPEKHKYTVIVWSR